MRRKSRLGLPIVAVLKVRMGWKFEDIAAVEILELAQKCHLVAQSSVLNAELNKSGESIDVGDSKKARASMACRSRGIKNAPRFSKNEAWLKRWSHQDDIELEMNEFGQPIRTRILIQNEEPLGGVEPESVSEVWIQRRFLDEFVESLVTIEVREINDVNSPGRLKPG